jgi:hypothetical protein
MIQKFRTLRAGRTRQEMQPIRNRAATHEATVSRLARLDLESVIHPPAGWPPQVLRAEGVSWRDVVRRVLQHQRVLENRRGAAAAGQDAAHPRG